METKSQLEKWWDEFFAPKPKHKPTPMEQLLRRKPKGSPNFRDKRMQRGVQIAKEKLQRATRLAFITTSVQQGNDLAKLRREAYLRRRGRRWRSLVEENLPRAFAEAMQAQGLGFELGSGNSVPGDVPANNMEMVAEPAE